MRRISSFLLLSFLLLVPSCSFLTTSQNGSADTSVNKGDQGYLKITRMTTGYYTTDYVFVSEEGYQFFAKGKMADGRDASYTYSAKWESSDESVFIVDNMGRVKALSNGTATLKATYEQYHDEIEVKVATYATLHAPTEAEKYYRTNRTYEMPYRFEPENALVEYSFSEEDSIDVLNSHSFIPKKGGEITVKAKVYVNEYGLPREDEFVLNVIENEKPYFIYEEEEKKELEIDVARYKYQSLNWAELGLAAYAGDDDSDITSNITVKSGTYDLSTVGEYPLVLSVTNKGVEATLDLKLNITEREAVKTKISHRSIEYNNLRWFMSSDLHTITFSATAILPEGFEDYWGSVGFYVQCETKRKVSGQKMTLDKYSSKYFEKTSVRYVAVSATCETENNLEMREGDENVTINRVFAEWDGIGYNYITYSPQ